LLSATVIDLQDVGRENQGELARRRFENFGLSTSHAQNILDRRLTAKAYSRPGNGRALNCTIPYREPWFKPSTCLSHMGMLVLSLHWGGCRWSSVTKVMTRKDWKCWRS